MDLAQDLPAVWNAPTTRAGTKQRLIRTLIEEVVIGLDDEANEAVLTIHWVGGRHSETRVPRRRNGGYPSDRKPDPVEVMRKLGGRFADRELAVTMNRMRCRSEDGGTWTTVRVRELRERLGIAAFDPKTSGPESISAQETAHRLGIYITSVHQLIREGTLPAQQLMPSAPWQIPVEALESEAVRIGVRKIIARRPGNIKKLQDVSTPRLPGIQQRGRTMSHDRTAAPRASMVRTARNPSPSITSRSGPTAATRRPRTATAPGEKTRRSASTLMRYALRTRRSQCRSSVMGPASWRITSSASRGWAMESSAMTEYDTEAPISAIAVRSCTGIGRSSISGSKSWC